jgi:hypothetical protein
MQPKESPFERSFPHFAEKARKIVLFSAENACISRADLVK